jgi:hypothetical protein
VRVTHGIDPSIHQPNLSSAYFVSQSVNQPISVPIHQSIPPIPISVSAKNRSRTFRKQLLTPYRRRCVRVCVCACARAPLALTLCNTKFRPYGLLGSVWFSGRKKCFPQKTQWPESASELYRPSHHRLSAKLVPTFADRGYRVVSATDPCGRILGFLKLIRKNIYMSSPYPPLWPTFISRSNGHCLVTFGGGYITGNVRRRIHNYQFPP